MRSIRFSIIALMAACFFSGCYQSGPKQVPIAAPTTTAPPAEEVEEEVEIDVGGEPASDEEMPEEGEAGENAEDATPNEEGDAPADEAGKDEEADQPDEPKSARASVFLKLLAQPLQDVMQANIESLGQGAGQF